MADSGVKISALPAASALDGTEIIPVVQDSQTARTTAGAIASLAQGVKISSVTLSTSWAGAGPYTQTVSVSGATSNSKIDLQPTAAQIAGLIADGVESLTIENNNGMLTAYSVGSAPSSAMTLQCTMTEVTAA